MPYKIKFLWCHIEIFKNYTFKPKCYIMSKCNNVVVFVHIKILLLEICGKILCKIFKVYLELHKSRPAHHILGWAD